MARLQNCITWGLLVLTVSVLLNTRPAEAANCNTADDCKNYGMCPTPLGTKPCDCSTIPYKGETCEDACDVNGDCGAGGSCNTGVSPRTCTCQAGYGGDQCVDEPECKVDTECESLKLEICNKDVNPYKCDCDSGYERDDDDDPCVKSGSESGSSLIQVSLLSLIMSLIVSDL